MKEAGLACLQEEVEGAQSHLNSADETCPSFLIAREVKQNCVSVCVFV